MCCVRCSGYCLKHARELSEARGTHAPRQGKPKSKKSPEEGKIRQPASLRAAAPPPKTWQRVFFVLPCLALPCLGVRECAGVFFCVAVGFGGSSSSSCPPGLIFACLPLTRTPSPPLHRTNTGSSYRSTRRRSSISYGRGSQDGGDGRGPASAWRYVEGEGCAGWVEKEQSWLQGVRCVCALPCNHTLPGFGLCMRVMGAC